MNKAKLLDLIRTEAVQFRTLLSKVDEDAAAEPNRCGSWSRKDILAHMLEWEKWLIEWLEPIGRGEAPAYVHNDDEVNEMNDLFVAKNTATKWRALVEEHRTTMAGVLEEVEAMSEPTLIDPTVAAWGDGRAIWELVDAITARHFKEHTNQLKV